MSDNLRVVIDTNIIVRAVSGRSFSNFIFDLLFDNQITLCVSTEILLEYEEKVTQIYDSLTADLLLGSLLVLPNVHRTDVFFDLRLIVQDADDDKFVNCAFATNAHYIVSDDRHFNILQKTPFPTIPVLKYNQFKEMFV